MKTITKEQASKLAYELGFAGVLMETDSDHPCWYMFSGKPEKQKWLDGNLKRWKFDNGGMIKVQIDYSGTAEDSLTVYQPIEQTVKENGYKDCCCCGEEMEGFEAMCCDCIAIENPTIKESLTVEKEEHEMNNLKGKITISTPSGRESGNYVKIALMDEASNNPVIEVDIDYETWAAITVGREARRKVEYKSFPVENLGKRREHKCVEIESGGHGEDKGTLRKRVLSAVPDGWQLMSDGIGTKQGDNHTFTVCQYVESAGYCGYCDRPVGAKYIETEDGLVCSRCETEYKENQGELKEIEGKTWVS